MDFLGVVMRPQVINVRIGHLDFGNLFAGEIGRQPALPELVFAGDFAGSANENPRGTQTRLQRNADTAKVLCIFKQAAFCEYRREENRQRKKLNDHKESNEVVQ